MCVLPHRLVLGACLTCVGLLLLAAPALADLPIPAQGLDNVQLRDGRVIRCQVGTEVDGRIPIRIEKHTFHVAAADVVEVRYFRDFDPAPHDDTEKARIEKGKVRWEGKWVSKKKADKLRAAEEARLRKSREDDETHAEWDHRWKLETKHFQIEANISRAKLDLYAEILEAYYSHLEKQLGIRLKGKWKKFKLPVFFFKHREEYLKRRRETGQDKGEHAAGHFVPTQGHEELVMFDQQEDMATTLEVMFHEATHFLIHLTDPNLHPPRWMNEACAEYYGGSLYEAGSFTPGQVHDSRVLGFLAAAKQGKIESLHDLMEAGNPGASPGLQSFPPRFYDQAWLIAHFCMNDPKYRKKWQKYVDKILSRKVKTQPLEASSDKFVHFDDDLALFRQTLKIKDDKAFQKKLVKYAKTMPLREARGYVRLGEMRSWIGDQKGALEAWEKAESLAGDDAEALFALSQNYRYNAPGKASLADRYLKQAVDLDPLDTRKRYVYSRYQSTPAKALEQLQICYLIDPDDASVLGDLATLTYQIRVGSPFKPQTDADKAGVEEAIGYARRAVDLAPDHRSRSILAILEMQQGDFEKALALQGKVVQEEPESTEYRSWLATFAALQGDAQVFAKTLRRSQLLLMRDSESAENVNRTLGTWLDYVVSACKAWGREKECARVLKVWYRRPPQSSKDWLRYIRVLQETRDGDALEAARSATEAFPDSGRLKRILEALES